MRVPDEHAPNPTATLPHKPVVEPHNNTPRPRMSKHVPRARRSPASTVGALVAACVWAACAFTCAANVQQTPAQCGSSVHPGACIDPRWQRCLGPASSDDDATALCPWLPGTRVRLVCCHEGTFATKSCQLEPPPQGVWPALVVVRAHAPVRLVPGLERGVVVFSCVSTFTCHRLDASGSSFISG